MCPPEPSHPTIRLLAGPARYGWAWAASMLLVLMLAGQFGDRSAGSHGAADRPGGAMTPYRPASSSPFEASWMVRSGLAAGTPTTMAGPEEPEADDLMDELQRHELRSPRRTVVRDEAGAWVASFTYGARTVTLAGPRRRFQEASAAHDVTSTTWVRVLHEPYRGQLDAGWLATAREDTSPDVLEVATQYLPDAPEVRTDDGVLVAGDAAYGPLDDDGDRPVGSDWNDYQQRVATYGAGTERHVRRPTRSQAGAMDCSGFVRMVFGIRHPVPLTSKVDGGDSLPRISRLQAREAPGVVPVTNHDGRITDLDAVRPGDLVFFDAGSDRRGIDHVGIHLGTDDEGNHRFISSRRSSNGPTMGDHLEPSLLDGGGRFARTFVATRRL